MITFIPYFIHPGWFVAFFIHPAWISGFIDGEGTFHVAIQKNSTIALGYQVQLQFAITQHIRDTTLMSLLMLYLGVGTVVADGSFKVQYRVRSLIELEILFMLLDNYPLVTQKRLDAEAFRQVHAMMKEGKHLTPEGLEVIRGIQKSMNRNRLLPLKKRKPR